MCWKDTYRAILTCTGLDRLNPAQALRLQLCYRREEEAWLLPQCSNPTRSTHISATCRGDLYLSSQEQPEVAPRCTGGNTWICKTASPNSTFCTPSPPFPFPYPRTPSFLLPSFTPDPQQISLHIIPAESWGGVLGRRTSMRQPKSWEMHKWAIRHTKGSYVLTTPLG